MGVTGLSRTCRGRHGEVCVVEFELNRSVSFKAVDIACTLDRRSGPQLSMHYESMMMTRTHSKTPTVTLHILIL